jgi:Rad3-related DNA helicase
VQAYGRSCRHRDDHGTTYLLDGQFERFLALDRALLPEWFLEAGDAALRDETERRPAARSRRPAG